MRRQHLLVIGGGPNQLPAISLARDLGFRVSVIDRDPHAVGRTVADDFAEISTRDVEAATDYAVALHRNHRIDGVMTMASESAVTVASIARALGLPGTTVEAAWRATHKGLRQDAFQAHGVSAPRFVRAATLEAVREACRYVGFPCVIKPVDSAGSRGVRKISGIRDIADAVAEVEAVSSTSEILIEEFLTGTEHSIEGIVIDGAVHWTGFSDRNYSRKESAPPYFLEDGDTLPSLLSSEEQAAARGVASEAVRALGIDWGPVKGDILIDEQGPKILEMAARLSGDYFCDVTVPLHNGIELIPAVMDLSLGLHVSRDRLEPGFARGVALRGVWSPGGKVQAIYGLDSARQQPGIRLVRVEPGWGEQMAPRETSMRDRLVAIVAVAATRAEAIERAEHAVSTIEIEADTSTGLSRQ